MQSIQYPPELPITARRMDIVAALRTSQVVVIAGDTGSGKTTQLPKMCMEAGLGETGMIGCTQPRRVAAMSISKRVAEELGVPWGREVGCKMRFNDDTSAETRIKFMTDGILLAEIQSDPLLRRYSALILDEAHERSLNIDFLMGYLQGLLKRRPDLKLVITSATIDTQAFSKAFGGAPVVEVSGRLFPVEVRYQPIESFSEDAESDDLSYIEAAARAAELALIESDDGDVLVFLPTERDIRECRELLEKELGRGAEVLGLFGRMASGDQQRIFAPGPQRRVVVATNIAETSLTIPRIRYVIDAGFSRISRYNPRTRTRRLPIEAVAQSSANQRKGRAGRLRDGVCIRLFSEEDFAERPEFAQPEIQRSNLAEVILRMKAFRLGEIEAFPFIDPPQKAAITAGYQLLHELGALDDVHKMTALGRELARLPIDPTLGRMLLQARDEGALHHTLVIAAGLSIPDPRERPEEKKEAATAAHRAFSDPESDFLSLLKIWQQGPGAEPRLGSGALRRWCKKNFLSPARIREWRDVYRQLEEAMRGRRGRAGSAEAKPDADYDAIHRSILAGHLGFIGMREERNTYKAAGNRRVTVFPGSSLYQRREKSQKKRPATAAKTKDSAGGPRWVVAGEIVQTSQLFARTIARVQPEWIIDLGGHLCRHRYSSPLWSRDSGRVLVWEHITIHGLEIQKKRVAYGRVAPTEATEIFLRDALVAGDVTLKHRFYAHNRKVVEKVETALTRVRSSRALDVSEALYAFYAERVENISSVPELDRLIRSKVKADPEFLCIQEADLIGDEDTGYDRGLFPDEVILGNNVLPVDYVYSPGTDRDGVTVNVPHPVARELTSGQIQWMVPGLREEQMRVLIRALPKSLRKQLMPVEPKVQELVQSFDPGRDEFLVALARHISQHYLVEVTVADWPVEVLPQHLRPRVRVVGRRKKTIVASRDLDSVQDKLAKKDMRSGAWGKLAQKWEKRGISSWSIGDLPESIVVEEIAGTTVHAYPGLAVREGEVDLQLFRNREEAEVASGGAVTRLAEIVLARDLGWLQSELASFGKPAEKKATGPGGALNSLSQLGDVFASGGEVEAPQTVAPANLSESAYRHLVRHVFRLVPVFPLTGSRFASMLADGQKELPILAHKLNKQTCEVLALKREVLASAKRYDGVLQDLQRLVPDDFLLTTPHAQLQHLPRYLKAIKVRAERSVLHPGRDQEKAKQLAAFAGWEDRVAPGQREVFRWMLEEFRVSVFAQELGTAQPVSAKRLRAFFDGD